MQQRATAVNAPSWRTRLPRAAKMQAPPRISPATRIIARKFGSLMVEARRTADCPFGSGRTTMP